METARPSKIRVTKLNEGQLRALVTIESDAAAQHHAQGIAGVAARGERDIVELTKQHNVRVAEADDVVAGYVAWRDESPGVAYIEDVLVSADFQRVGVGDKLLAAVREEAKGLKVPVMLIRARAGAPWASAFLEKEGFAPLDDAAPAVVKTWKGEQTAGGKPLAGEGIAVLWAKI
jgi:amino-acid N-acetyltransferase